VSGRQSDEQAIHNLNAYVMIL